MATEIERKFLLGGDGWRSQVKSAHRLKQAYLARTGQLSARVRTVDGKRGFLTIKSAEPGMSRAEYEYEIPVADAEELMRLREGRLIEKTRHLVESGSLTWEIDVFHGALAGLAIAEVELPSEDAAFERPAWLGREVTGENAYYNAHLAMGEGPPR